MRSAIAFSLLLAACATTHASSQATAPAPASSSSFAREAGFIPIRVSRTESTIQLELPGDTTRALLFTDLATGLGSNPVGLDRAADSRSYIVRFVHDGDRVLVTLENWNYRSSLGGANARTIAESFPPSTMASLKVVSSDGGKLVVDATDLLFFDWIGVPQAMRSANQGNWSLARDRSSLDRTHTHAFPDNTELESALTFTSDNAGDLASAILPDARAFTVHQHLSLIRLPDDNFKPRERDQRVGYFSVDFKDYGQPIQLALDQHWILKHRLERVNPADPTSAIKNPIVYYIDRGIPEPVHSAMVEGAKWWEQAFADAGLPGAFIVRDLPDSVDPMDARYNVVMWENRNERGWSVGGAQIDIRTGEIVKGMARLDSHRARTDYNLYAGMMGADASAADTAFVLARVRQVTAHEIGHTLGLAHNYIASTYDRGSVMDYPTFRMKLAPDGSIDISNAYAKGIGAYDVWAIHWGYGIFPPGTEQDSLNAIIAEGARKGFLFLSDADARPEFASDPRTNLWDDRASAIEFLKDEMAVRRKAIDQFGLRNIRTGEPLAILHERFVPVYLMHRFALNAASRTIGGMEYAFVVKGEARQATQPIDGPRQREALSLMLSALAPQELAIPDTVLTLLAPRPDDYPNSVELFGSRTRPAFDELGAAATLSQMIVNMLLQPDRDARLVMFAPRLKDPLTLPQLIDALVGATWRAPVPASAKLAALQRVSQRVVADRLLTLAADTTVAEPVRGIVDYEIAQLRDEARRRAASGTVEARAHWASIANDFTRWTDRHELPNPTPANVAPPGDPF